MDEMHDVVEVAIELCRDTAIMPEYARLGDAGMDIFAAEDVLVCCGETVIVPTGLKVAIPAGYEIQIRPRSGLCLHTPLRVSNSPGTIDSGYKDEIGVIISNTSDCEGVDIYTISEKGNKKGKYLLKKGDRIAQLVLQFVPTLKFIQVHSVKNIGHDRGGGFGSTGTR